MNGRGSRQPVRSALIVIRVPDGPGLGLELDEAALRAQPFEEQPLRRLPQWDQEHP